MSEINVWRAADYVRMPWKNGGGQTIEIAVQPPAAGLDDFGWRLSIATISQDGAFSRFAGIDRTLALLDGAGLRLEIGAAKADAGQVTRTVELRPGDAPLHFDGAAPVAAQLRDGPVRDLNLMTRRGVWRQRMSPHRLAAGHALQHRSSAACQLWLCHEGSLRVATADDDHSFELGALDALRADAASRADAAAGATAIDWRLHAASPCTAWFIELDPVEPDAPMR